MDRRGAPLRRIVRRDYSQDRLGVISGFIWVYLRLSCGYEVLRRVSKEPGWQCRCVKCEPKL